MGSRSLSVSAAVVSVVVTSVACSGPRPEVLSATLSKVPGEIGLYLVDISVRNRSGGEGEAQLLVRLRDPRSGIVYDGGSVTLELVPHGSARRMIEVRAPLDGHYIAEVDARYPAS